MGPVLVGGQGGGGGDRHARPHIRAGVPQLLDGEKTLIAVGGDLLGLHTVAVLDPIPAEAVLLARGHLGEGQAGILVVGLQIPVHHVGIGTGAPDGLHGGTARELVGVLALVKAVDGVDAQHTEDGGLAPRLGGLGGTEHIVAGGVVAAAVVAAPEGVGVHAPLLTADADGGQVVLVAHVVDRMGIQEPGARHLGVEAEGLLEEAEGLVDEGFPLLGGVGGEEAGVDEPVPIVAGTASPLDAHGLGEGAAHLKPQAQLHMLIHFGLHQLHHIGTDEGVVLHEHGMVEAVALVDGDLLLDGGIEILPRLAGLTAADEIDEIHDALLHGGCSFQIICFLHAVIISKHIRIQLFDLICFLYSNSKIMLYHQFAKSFSVN